MSFYSLGIEKTKRDLERDIGNNEACEGLLHLDALLSRLHIMGTETEDEELMYHYLKMFRKFVEDFEPHTIETSDVVCDMLGHVKCGVGQINEAFSEMATRLEDCDAEKTKELDLSVVKSVMRDLQDGMLDIMKQGEVVMYEDLPDYINNNS